MKKINLKFKNKPFPVVYSNNFDEFSALLGTIKPAKIYGLDIETCPAESYKKDKRAGLVPTLSAIRLIQIYDGEMCFVFDLPRDLSIPHRVCTGYRKLQDFLRSNKFIAHNAVFEIGHLLHSVCNHDNTLDIECSMIMGQFLYASEHSPFEPDEDDEDPDSAPRAYKNGGGASLANLSKKYLDVVIDKNLQVSDWSVETLTVEQISYAALDALLTYELGKVFLPQLIDRKMWKAYLLYKEMQNVVVEMQLNGMHIDENAHKKCVEEWESKREALEVRCKIIFGDRNLRSPKQMHEWAEANVNPKVLKLWEKSQKTKFYTFNKNKLSLLIPYVPNLKFLVEYKKYATLLSTFGNSLKDKVNPVTGNIHCNFTLAETRTGRLSSRDPNLQNMPSREGSFKHIFVPRYYGCVLIVADYNQIEIRVAGEVSRDPVIIESYRQGLDLHKAIVADLENKPIDKVTKEERQLGKAINFGLQFGMGPTKLQFYAFSSYGVRMSEEAAQNAWAAYHKKYAVYSNWCKAQRQRCEKYGYVRTPLGKIRKLEPNEVYTKAVNTPVQGGAAEVMFTGLTYLRNSKYKGLFSILNSVHDEVIVECAAKDADTVKNVVETELTNGMLYVFPEAPVNGLVAAKEGLTWADAKD